jgi:glycosyltransferase involved in cell wall biosynthesis
MPTTRITDYVHADTPARQPLVTVGMPVYNEHRFIAAAIESVLRQTLTDLQLLISDDASTDGTKEICARFASQDQRIRLVEQPTNLGPFLNLKYVTDEASSPLLVWLAQDDMLDERYLEQCVQRIDANSRSVLVSTDFKIIDESGRAICTETLTRIRGSIPWHTRRVEFFKFPVYSNTFYSFYGMMRTAAAQKMFSQLPKPKYMSQIELPVLARLAVLGEIESFAQDLRYYRRVGTSLYHTERKSLLAQSALRRVTVQTLRYAGLIADQVGVLFRSDVPMRPKAAILLHLVYFYCVKCVALIARGKPASGGTRNTSKPSV